MVSMGGGGTGGLFIGSWSQRVKQPPAGRTAASTASQSIVTNLGWLFTASFPPS